MKNLARPTQFAIFACLIATAGCVRDAEDYTTSAFATAVASGSSSAQIVSSTLTHKIIGSDVNSDGDGYAYEIGVDGGEGFVARAGLLPGTRVPTLPTSGSATLTGTYEAARVAGIDLDNGRLIGFARKASGAITLEADFAGNTLSGRSDNDLLKVNGTFDDENLTGTVTYRDIPGALRGKIGGTEAIGIFHGKTSSSLMAGGFMVK